VILISGDFHANSRNELELITKSSLKKHYGPAFKTIQYHIILGDAGFLWPGNDKTDLYNAKILAARPFKTLFLGGNHEPIYGRDLKEFEQIDLGFGHPVYKIYEDFDVYYLERGFSYDIENKHLLVLGGALSIDKAFRRENISWWPGEYWTPQEEERCLELLKTDNRFDYVLSHTGPNFICKQLLSVSESAGRKLKDKVAIFNEDIDNCISFGKWLFGHWHFDRICSLSDKTYQCLYKTTLLI
jgi:hypothetical protein